MDKETQEKLDIVRKVAGVIKSSIHIRLKGTQLELWGFNLAALDSITLLEQLGYHKPKEKPIGNPVGYVNVH